MINGEDFMNSQKECLVHLHSRRYQPVTTVVAAAPLMECPRHQSLRARVIELLVSLAGHATPHGWNGRWNMRMGSDIFLGFGNVIFYVLPAVAFCGNARVHVVV